MIGVVGAGTMGVGIAVSLLTIDEEVMLVEANEERRQAATGDVRHSLERLAKKNSDLDVEACLAQLNLAEALDGTAQCSVVIEAVPEKLHIKQTIFTELDAMHGSDVMLASNTSSLSITKIANGLNHPERVIGTHFFNPVPVSSLVEIVVGEQSSQEVTSAAQRLVEKLGKTPIVVSDSPGFASSRLGLCLGLEAIRMLEQGVGSAADIDTAMELGYRHPMGPLRLTDLVGLDVRLAIAQHLESELGPTFTPPQLLIDMVARGKLGKKVGQGFYKW